MAPSPPKTPSKAPPSTRGKDISPLILGKETITSQQVSPPWSSEKGKPSNSEMRQAQETANTDKLSDDSEIQQAQETANTDELIDDSQIQQAEETANTDELIDDSEIEEAQEAIQACYDGGSMLDKDLTFTLNELSYAELRQSLEASGLLQYFVEEVRSNWDSDTGELTLLAMAPSTIHEATERNLSLAIWQELDRVAENNRVLSATLAKLNMKGQSTVGDPEKKGKHFSPDMQFSYGDDGTTFVVEVAFTQSTQSVTEKVANYFKNEPGVRTVLVIDIAESTLEQRKAGHKHKAKVSLYTGERDGKNIIVRRREDAVFREEDGSAADGKLTIPYYCFLPPKRKTIASHKPALEFTFESLAKIVERAEDCQRREEKRREDERQESQDPAPEPEKLIWKDEKDLTLDEELIGPPSKRRKTGHSSETFAHRTRSGAAAAN